MSKVCANAYQVWSLTQFFPFSEKSLICLEGKSMTPHRGNTNLFRSSQQLPRLRLGPIEGLFELTRTLLGPSTRLVRCFRNYRDTRTPSGCAALGAEVPGHRQQQLTQTLIVRL